MTVATIGRRGLLTALLASAGMAGAQSIVGRPRGMSQVGLRLFGGSISPGVAPFFDTFTTDGALSSRSGWAVTTTTAQASFASVLSTLSGNVRSTNGAAANVYGLHDSAAGAAESRAWAKTVAAASGQAINIQSFIAHGSMDATAGATAITIGQSGGTILYHNSIVNGTATSRNVAAALLSGMVVEHRTVNDAGTLRAQLVLNGRRVQPVPAAANTTINGIDIAGALGRAANGKYGFGGSSPNPTVREFGTSNPATDAWITVTSAGGVRQSGKPFYLFGEYGGARAPTAAELSVAFYNDADESVVTGFGALSVSNFTAAGGLWSATVTNPGTDNIWGRVTWTFPLFGGGTGAVSYPTALIRLGDVIALDGQSQMEFLDNQAGDTSYAASSYSAYKFLADVGIATDPSQRNLALAGNCYNAMSAALQPYTTRPTLYVTCAKGGTPYRGATDATSRAKPSPQYDATLDALRTVAGGRPAMFCLAGGTSAETGSIVTNIIAYADALDADLGTALLYGVLPEGSVTTGGAGASTTYAAQRRAMWTLCRDYPSRFKLLGWRNELQHNIVTATVDTLHYAHPGVSTGYVQGTTLGDAEYARRIAAGVAFHLYGGPDYRGPAITTATSPSKTSTTLRIYFALGGFDALEVANTSYASDFSGGFEFNSASGFAGTVYTPTSVAIGTPSGGVCYVEWTFAALPATVYARVHPGDNPFNRADTLAINQNMQARASTLRGTKTGVPPVAVQPSYEVGGAGVDYLTV